MEDGASSTGNQFMNDIQGYAAIKPVMPAPGNRACSFSARPLASPAALPQSPAPVCLIRASPAGPPHSASLAPPPHSPAWRRPRRLEGLS
jgi:hypothetical protein